MRLENNEYRVKEMDELKTITITKEALEKWRDHYNKIALEIDAEEMLWKRMFYLGKAEVLIDLLNHFEEEWI